MNWSHLLFINDIRLSTLVLGGIFLIVGTMKRKPIQGALLSLAWVFSFEAAWSVAAYSFHIQQRMSWGWFVLAIPLILWAARYEGLDYRLALIAAGLFGVWILTGFPVNAHTTVGFNVWAEIINEVTKTVWGLAFLVPQIKKERSRSLSPLFTS